MTRAERKTPARRKPNAAWAWEGLRRNPEYRRLYFADQHRLPDILMLNTGATLLRAKSRSLEAEKWGLLTLANPNLCAVDADVFWVPALFAASLEVRLSPLTSAERADPKSHDFMSLAQLQTRRVLLETVDGSRHILLNGRRFWIHLFCNSPSVIGESAHIGIRMNETTYMGRRLDTATQLLSLYRSGGGKITLIGRRKSSERLEKALLAYDIWTGFERPKGQLRDIAIALVGQERVNSDWNGPSRYLKDMAARYRNKGIAFVESDYLDLLTKKTL